MNVKSVYRSQTFILDCHIFCIHMYIEKKFLHVLDTNQVTFQTTQVLINDKNDALWR